MALLPLRHLVRVLFPFHTGSSPGLEAFSNVVIAGFYRRLFFFSFPFFSSLFQPSEAGRSAKSSLVAELRKSGEHAVADTALVPSRLWP
jgi:hypothetical protein